MSHRQRQSRRRRRRGGGRSKVLLALGVLAITCAIARAVAGRLRARDRGHRARPERAQAERQGRELGDLRRRRLAARLRRSRTWCARWSRGRDIPVVLRRATVAIEDERFYKHKGVDYNAIVRAGVRNLESGENLQGGSTITQQLVRALYIKDPQRNFTAQDPRGQARLGARGRALQDLDPPQLPERHPVRDRRRAHRDRRRGRRGDLLLEARAASSTCAESATLAGLPQAPSQYNPFRNPTAALERRNEVLDRMAENGFISRGEADAAAQSAARRQARHPLQHAGASPTSSTTCRTS